MIFLHGIIIISSWNKRKFFFMKIKKNNFGSKKKKQNCKKKKKMSSKKPDYWVNMHITKLKIWPNPNGPEFLEWPPPSEFTTFNYNTKTDDYIWRCNQALMVILESLDQGSSNIIFLYRKVVKLILNFCLFLLLGIQTSIDKIYIPNGTFFFFLSEL